MLPKVESAEDVRWLDRLLGMLGERASTIRLQALVETAGGLCRAGEIAAASPRLDALILGYADLAASLSRPGGDDGPERWLYAQETVLVAARAAGVQAVDGPFLAMRDEEGLRSRAEHARALGFDGKWAVHPDQVAVLNEAFTPAAEEFGGRGRSCRRSRARAAARWRWTGRWSTRRAASSRSRWSRAPGRGVGA